MPFIAWWCQVLQVTDPLAVNVAAGVFAGGVLLIVVRGILIWLMAMLSLFEAYFSR